MNDFKPINQYHVTRHSRTYDEIAVWFTVCMPACQYGLEGTNSQRLTDQRFRLEENEIAHQIDTWFDSNKACRTPSSRFIRRVCGELSGGDRAKQYALENYAKRYVVKTYIERTNMKNR